LKAAKKRLKLTEQPGKEKTREKSGKVTSLAPLIRALRADLTQG